ncbi:hypothetical protein ADL26_20605, partial [Thermoactinomyces vulgaris]
GGEEGLAEGAGLGLAALGCDGADAGHGGRGLDEEGVEEEFDRAEVGAVADDGGEAALGPVDGAAVVGVGDLGEEFGFGLLVGALDEDTEGFGVAFALACFGKER